MAKVGGLLEVQVLPHGTLQGLKEFPDPELDITVAVLARDPAQECQ
jgi:hypothetical protein